MISTIDRNRIFIFVGITYGIVIVSALVIFFDGGHKSDFTPVTPLAIIFSNLIGYAPALANIATRPITREGWSNTYLRPNLRRGWPYRSSSSPAHLPIPARHQPLLLSWEIRNLSRRSPAKRSSVLHPEKREDK